MSLRCIRNEEWEAAGGWFAKIRNNVNVCTDDSLAHVYTALYMLEGLILYLVGKMDRRNIRAVAHVYDEISKLMNNLQTLSKTMKCILPRQCCFNVRKKLSFYKIWFTGIIIWGRTLNLCNTTTLNRSVFWIPQRSTLTLTVIYWNLLGLTILKR